MRKRFTKAPKRALRSVSASKSMRRGRKIMASTAGKYDYLEAMVDDIMDLISINDYEYEDRYELEEQLNDDLWIDNNVTGNGGANYFNTDDEARDAIRGNEDLLIEAIEEFGDDAESYKKALKDPNYADTTIRCYLLGQAIGEALDRMGIE